MMGFAVSGPVSLDMVVVMLAHICPGPAEETRTEPVAVIRQIFSRWSPSSVPRGLPYIEAALGRCLPCPRPSRRLV